MGCKVLFDKIAKHNDHKQGNNKSQVPAGRSARDKRKYGRKDAGE
jgi:hypothetical protein